MDLHTRLITAKGEKRRIRIYNGNQQTLRGTIVHVGVDYVELQVDEIKHIIPYCSIQDIEMEN